MACLASTQRTGSRSWKGAECALVWRAWLLALSLACSAAPEEAWYQRHSVSAPGELREEPRAVAVDSVGDVVMAGGNGDFLLIKYSGTDGQILWQVPGANRLQPPGHAIAIRILADDDIVVTGPTDRDTSTARYSGKTGALIWQQRYDGPAHSGGVPRSMALTGKGRIVVSGYSGRGDFYTALYGALDGQLLWEAHSEGVAALVGKTGQTVAADPLGDVFVCGLAFSPAELPPRTVFTWLAKLDGATGSTLWGRAPSR